MTSKKNARVLVIDDDDVMRSLLRVILREDGFTVVGEAGDGEAGLALCERLLPDLVCLDVNMPGMSGIEVLKLLRNGSPGVRVVMVTADATMATVREAVGLGASGYIVKPFKAGRVTDTLRQALGAPSNPGGPPIG